MHGWLDTVGFFIPRGVREPFWEHMLEDRDAMIKQGRSRTFVRCAIVSQFGWLAVMSLKDTIAAVLFAQFRTPRQ
jgi:hypothetical protein